MRALLLLALLAGCADDAASDPHEIVECGNDWILGHHVPDCEAACRIYPGRTVNECPTADLALCSPLDVYVEFDGVGGCCRIDGGADGTVRWTACE